MAASSSPHLRGTILSSRPLPKALERLPQVNYSLLKDNALRKKLSELGIPNSGQRALLIKRHTEWINLVNANCDSTKPRTKRELLHDLDMWDKTQGRQIANSSTGGTASSVMNKDFDGLAWAANHDQDFQSLIAKARRKAAPKTQGTGKIDKLGEFTPKHFDSASESVPLGSTEGIDSIDSHRQEESTPASDDCLPRPAPVTQINIDD